MKGTSSKTNSEDKKTTSFSNQSVASSGINDPDKYYSNDKLQEIYSSEFYFENLKIFSKQLRDKTFSTFHIIIKNLSKSTDKLKELLNVKSVVVVTENWCYKTVNKNSLLELLYIT